MMVEVNMIIKAVKSTVPQPMWSEIVAKLQEPQQRSKALDVETEALDEAADAFDPAGFAEEDDDF